MIRRDVASCEASADKDGVASDELLVAEGLEQRLALVYKLAVEFSPTPTLRSCAKNVDGGTHLYLILGSVFFGHKTCSSSTKRIIDTARESTVVKIKALITYDY